MSAALTDKQLRFVFEYLQDQNATAAARRAGYAAKGACAQGNALLRMPAVSARIRDEMRSLLAEVKVSVMDLLRERVRAALFRADNLFGAGWTLREREAVDVETRAALQVSATWRKGEPTLRVAQPSRERALAVLEKLHERLDRQSQACCEAEEPAPARKAGRKSAPAPASASHPPGAGIVLDVHREVVGLVPAIPAAAGSLSVSWGGHLPAETRAAPATEPALATQAPPPDPAPANSPAPEAPPIKMGEKPIVSSGSPQLQAQVQPQLQPQAPPLEPLEPSAAPADPPVKLSPFAEVLAANRKEQPKTDNFRDDPNWMWGGKAKPVPPPEPSASLLEHLANVKHAELNAHVAQEMARRGGRIRPGPLRPSGLPPGYNPPWLRDDRPRFAEGAGEFYWSGDGPEN